MGRPPPDRDLLSRCVPEELLAAPRSGLRHLTDALRKSLEGEALAGPWRAAIDWYRERKPEDLERLTQGLFHTGKKENLTGGLAGALYRREGSTLRISPSGLERYSRCPFAYWMNYGIRPENRLAYQITGRDLGDIYHRCLMEISRKLTQGREAITQPDSLWMTLTREQCFRLTDQAVEQEAGRYREGLLDQGPEERYKTERIKRVCREITWALIGHVRQGRIRRVAFEAGFGSGSGAVFPAIRMEAGGHSVEIEGKIDRVDVLPGDRAKIIDYKSGNERFRLLEAATGYRLQLMIYLKAVQDAIAPQEPGAGVFYFHIEEAMLDASGVAAEQLEEALKQEQARRYRLDGMLLDDEEVIRSIAGEFTDYSGVCSLRRSGGSIRGTGPGRLLTEEEFRELRQRVDGLLAELCRELLEGKVPASPMKSDSESACDYCPFQTVCGFDTALPGCRYRSIS